MLQVSSAVEQMAATMAQVSRNAEASAGSARQVLEQVRLSDSSVTATVEGMASIDASVASATGRMKALEQRSREIFEIIGLIEEIATQSNLLSLNAAIEAAHAGAAGRGFGVVADEIRRLADRSKQATADVGRIVEGLVEETRQALEAISEVQSGVASGREHSTRARRGLDEISVLVRGSVQRTEEISVAAREQADTTRVVAGAVQAIADVSRQSSLGAQESTVAVGGLVASAEQLARTIAQFHIAAVRPAPAPSAEAEV